jgi:hypothetical protein
MLKDVPVLLISFNRPEMTKGAIENMRLFKPNKVYFAVDGPRMGKIDDIESVELCRKLIKEIDWECEVTELFSSVNYGSGEWPYRSITRALLEEDYLLIIEDDVRISLDFYELLKEVLERYENNKNIFAVCASNISEEIGEISGDDYFFTKYFSGWGWATWADRWQQYEFKIAKKEKLTFLRLLKENGYNFLVGLYFYLNFHLIKKNKLQAWDYQINHMIFLKDMLNIKVSKNQSINEGIGEKATHTKFMPNLKVAKIDIENIKHPLEVLGNKRFDRIWRKDRMRFILNSWLKRLVKI